MITVSSGEKHDTFMTFYRAWFSVDFDAVHRAEYYALCGRVF